MPLEADSGKVRNAVKNPAEKKERGWTAAIAPIRTLESRGGGEGGPEQTGTTVYYIPTLSPAADR